MKKNKIIGITFGSFDLCHYGHALMFEECKDYCDHLIVGLQTDPSIDRQNKNQPIQSVFERYVHLNAVKYVDEIIPYDTEQSLLDLLEATPIDLRFIGEDWSEKHFTGKGLHEIYYTSRAHSFSSSELRQRLR